MHHLGLIYLKMTNSMIQNEHDDPQTLGYIGYPAQLLGRANTINSSRSVTLVTTFDHHAHR